MFWVLCILVRSVRGCKNSTCVQLCIPSTCIPCFKGICVRLSPAGYSFDVVGTLEDARIPHTYYSVFLLLLGIAI